MNRRRQKRLKKEKAVDGGQIFPFRPTNGKRVVVAMSGGVDSSVAAALLKTAGFDVVGVFMKFWAESLNQDNLVKIENRCCSLEAENRARKVAGILNIPFYVFDFEKEFKKKIVDNFLKGYRMGLTPNPCALCNKEIKFGLLLEKALRLGADFIATGHYAKVKMQKLKIKSPSQKSKVYQLFRGRDKEKDQSYFLWMLNQSQLKKILFPVGDYTKAKVRDLAKKFKLPVSDIPESQEVCFVISGLSDFLKKYIKQKPGKIILKGGKTIGKHQGLHFYTIGQRKGIELSGGPYYVLAKDLKNNNLIVAKNRDDLLKKEFIVKDINWISGPPELFPFNVETKVRYGHNPASSRIYQKIKNKERKVIFDKPQMSVAPGQSAVFLRKNEILGGGIII